MTPTYLKLIGYFSNYSNPNKYFYLFLAISILCFFVFKELILSDLDHHLVRLVAYLFTAGLIYANWSLSIRNLPKSFRIIVTTLVVLFGTYLSLTYPSIPEGHVNFFVSFELFCLRYFAVVCAVLFFVKPAFGIFPLVHTLIYKNILISTFGYSISFTDYAPLVEAGIYLYICTGLTIRFFDRHSYFKINHQSISYLEFATLVSIFVHLSNYFYSGLKKIWIADYSLSWWVFHNKTHYLILDAWALNQLPLSFSDHISTQSYLLLSQFFIPANVFVLIIQLAAILCFLGKKWIVGLTFMFDLMHLMIFLFTGILFYKWMIYNFAIILAVPHIKFERISSQMKLMFVLIVLCAPMVFFVAKLGWFDTRALNNAYFVAVTQEGKRYKVPSNYFLQHSVRIAQQRAIRKKTEPFFPTGTYGVIFGRSKMMAANKCEYPKSRDVVNIAETISSKNLRLIENLIRVVHQYYIQEEERAGKTLDYDFYPHHIFSMPWEFSDFKTLRKKHIAYYEYRIESTCLSLTDNKFKKDIPVTGKLKISLEPQSKSN